MAYNRLPYQPYDDVNASHPFPTGYPQESAYQEEYRRPMPYDTYDYQMNPYAEPPYPDYREPLPMGRRDAWEEYPRDYPRGGPPLEYDEEAAMALDYREPVSERPRESWAERNERDDALFNKRETDDRPRPSNPYRPRRPVDRPTSQRNLDPYTLDHVVPFSNFCEWYKQANARNLSRNAEINREELQESFIKYKEDLLARTAKGFVMEHMSDEWFKEKYNPNVSPATRTKLVNYRKWLYEKFMQDLDGGAFDELTSDGAAARRYYAEKGGHQTPSRKDEDEDYSLTTIKILHDPMTERRTPCIKTISTTVSRAQLEALLEGIEGFKYLSLSDPNSGKKFARVGWVILTDSGNPDDVVRQLDEKSIHDETHGDFVVHCAIHSPPKEQTRKALSELHSLPENLLRDLQLAEQCATQKFEKEMGEGYAGIEKIKGRVKMLIENAPKDMGEDEEEGAVKEDDGLETVLETKKLLDLTTEYLRRVYSFCFYCVCESDSVYEVQRKCFAGHFRRPPPQSNTDTKTSITQKQWVDKLNLFINPDQADVIKLGGVEVEDFVNKEITATITREAEDRWRCTVKKCTKLFLEEKFVRSHIQKRHKDWLEQLSMEAQMLNSYVRDPCRVLPHSVEQPPTGFGVKHHSEKEFNNPPRFDPIPAVIPTFTGYPQFAFGQGMFDAPADWNMRGGYSMDDRPIRGRRGGPGGPVRRGMEGGRDHPYERRSGWNERRDNGDGYPVDRTRVRETRPLRSYRDLDAPQEATPELHY